MDQRSDRRRQESATATAKPQPALLVADVTDPTATRPESLPQWFRSMLYAALVWVAGAGAAGLFLLWRSMYHPVLCAALATLALATVWRFRPRVVPGHRAAHAPALIAVATAVLFLLGVGATHSEHILTDRDPAVYINTGRTIARTHEVFQHRPESPFRNAEYRDTAGGFGVREDEIRPNFLHFLPVLLALGWSAGGDTGLLLVPGAIGALGLLGVYALAATVAGPRFALVAPALLVLSPLQPWFARDAYSELPVQLFTVGGTWLLLAALATRTPITAAVGGAIIGAASFARVDATMLIGGVPILVALEHVRSTARQDPQRRVVPWAFAGGIAVSHLLAYRVAEALSRGYRRYFAHEYRQLWLVVLVSAVAGLLIIAGSRLRPGLGSAFARTRLFDLMLVVPVVSVATWAYVARPRPRSDLPVLDADTPLTRELQRSINAWHYSYSLRWFGWYFGIVALVAALTGLLVMVRRAARGSSAATAVVALVLPATLLYLARPRITPDHMWAMRRYLPVVIPGVVIAVAVALAALFRFAYARSQARMAVVATVTAAVLVFGGAARASAPIVGGRIQHGALGAVHGVCRSVGDDGAILVLPYVYFDLTMPQTLRGFCGVPVSKPFDPTTIDVPRLAVEWADEGRRLFVVAPTRELTELVVPTAVEVASFVIDDRYDPEVVLTHRPGRYEPRPVTIFVYEVPAGNGSLP